MHLIWRYDGRMRNTAVFPNHLVSCQLTWLRLNVRPFVHHLADENSPLINTRTFRSQRQWRGGDKEGHSFMIVTYHNHALHHHVDNIPCEQSPTNSLFPEKLKWNLRWVILNLIQRFKLSSIEYREILLMTCQIWFKLWHVAWTSHYVSPRWPRSMSSYVVTGPQLVKSIS